MLKSQEFLPLWVRDASSDYAVPSSWLHACQFERRES